MNPRVVFVGAGPVGLMAAIQTKLYCPDLPILMLEKHEEYQRKHPLLLDHHSFYGSHPDPDFQAFLNNLPSKIRTNELEAGLLQYAKMLGINIEYSRVTDTEALASQYPDADVIVGAGGSHSLVHEQVFDHEYQIKKNMQYIAEMKYEVEGGTRPLGKLREMVPTMTFAKHFVSEFVGKETDGKTPVSIRVFVNQETYEQMKGASFKNPYHLNDISNSNSPAVAALYRSLDVWSKARAELAGEKRIEGSERISVTNLPVYAAKEFVKQKHGKTWVLVGDAAFGVPYFRSLNNGILCSSRLAKMIHAKLHGNLLQEDSKFSSTSKKSFANEVSPEQYYQDYVQGLVAHENWVAGLKNTGLTSLKAGAAVSRTVPMSRTKLAMTSEGRHYKKAMKSSASVSESSFSKFGASSSKRRSSKKSSAQDKEPTSALCRIM